MKIYDCITFFQETLQVELRFNILKDVVDFFTFISTLLYLYYYLHSGSKKIIVGPE